MLIVLAHAKCVEHASSWSVPYLVRLARADELPPTEAHKDATCVCVDDDRTGEWSRSYYV